MINTYTPYYGIVKTEPQFTRGAVDVTINDLTLSENCYPIVIHKSLMSVCAAWGYGTSTRWYRVIYSNGLCCKVIADYGDAHSFVMYLQKNPKQFIEMDDNNRVIWQLTPHQRNIKTVKKSIESSINEMEERLKDYSGHPEIDNIHRRYNLQEQFLYYIEKPRLPDQMIDIIKYYFGDNESFTLDNIHNYVRGIDNLIEKPVEPKPEELTIKTCIQINNDKKAAKLEKIISQELEKVAQAELISREELDNKKIEYVYSIKATPDNFGTLIYVLEKINARVVEQRLIQ